MARKRTPSDQALPKYVYLRRGWYILRPYLSQGKFGKDIKLIQAPAQISEIWQAYEKATQINAPRKTLAWLIEQYLASPQHAAKAVKTRKEYEKNAVTVTGSPIKSGGTFGQVDAERITPGVIRKYIDARTNALGEPAPVAANREKAFMSVCYSWAVERDLIKKNPCKEVRSNSEKARDRYVTDAEYQIIYDMASQWPLVQVAMELAFLCRMRLCEVLALKQSDITDQGLIIKRRKGSRGNIVTWSPRLRAAIDASDQLPRPAIASINLYLIRGQRGSKLTETGFSSIWQRIQVDAAEQDHERFTFHDLKAKGISDTLGNKQEASGHKSAAMLNTYNRKLALVKPAGE